MAIAANAKANLMELPNPGGEDRLPSGIWWGMVDSTAGDASGSPATVRILYPGTPDTQRETYIYSVEHAWGRTSTGALNGLLRVSYILAAARLARYESYLLNRIMGQLAAPDANSYVYADSVRLWLPATQISVLIDVTNPTGAGTFGAGAWGYVWRLGAMDQPGGPIIPWGVTTPPFGIVSPV